MKTRKNLVVTLFLFIILSGLLSVISVTELKSQTSQIMMRKTFIKEYKIPDNEEVVLFRSNDEGDKMTGYIITKATIFGSISPYEVYYVYYGNVKHGPFEEEPGTFYSPGGKYLYYHACIDDEDYLFINGVMYGPYYYGVASPVFSPDGERFAFVSGEDDGYYVNCGKEKYGPYYFAGLMKFSPDSKHLYYCAESRPCYLYRDGEEISKALLNISGITIYKDSKRVVYGALNFDDEWRIINGDEIGKPCDEVVRITLSPDEKHLAAIMRTPDNKHKYVACEGQRTKNYLDVNFLVFTNDNKLVYGVKDIDQQWYVICQNKVQGPYYEIFPKSVRISSNNVVAYVARTLNVNKPGTSGYYVICGDKISEVYSAVNFLNPKHFGFRFGTDDLCYIAFKYIPKVFHNSNVIHEGIINGPYSMSSLFLSETSPTYAYTYCTDDNNFNRNVVLVYKGKETRLEEYTLYAMESRLSSNSKILISPGYEYIRDSNGKVTSVKLWKHEFILEE